MGGRIAQWLAADYPDRVAALALGSTTPGDRHGVPRAPHVTRLLTGGECAARSDLFVSAGFRRRQPLQAAGLAPAVTGPRALRAHWTASQGHDAWAVLPSITAPTLVLHGALDEVCPPRNAELLAHRIPHASLRRVPAGRHAFHVELPQTAHWVEDHCRRFDLTAG